MVTTWSFTQVRIGRNDVLPVRSDPSAPDAGETFHTGCFEATELGGKARGRVWIGPKHWARLLEAGWLLTWAPPSGNFLGAMLGSTVGDGSFEYLQSVFSV